MEKRWTTALAAGLILAGAGASALAAAPDDDGMGGQPPAAKAPAAPAATAAEDVLVLKDGTEIHGRITAENETDYAVKVGGALRVVGKTTVKEVRRGSPPAEGGADDGATPGAAPAPGATPGATPGGGDEKEKRKFRKRMEKKGENPDSMPPGGEDGAAPPPPLGDEAKAWAKSCLERLLSSTDPSIQRSATEALRGFGPAVLPVLREARDARGTDDEKARQAISRVITMIEKGPRPGGEGGKRPAPPNGNEGNPDKKPGQPPRGPAMLERVKTELGLDDTQLRPVGQALLQFGRDAREVGMDARDGLITYEDARTKVTELRGKLKDGLRSTLNEDQLKKLDSLLDEMGKKMGGGPAKDAPK